MTTTCSLLGIDGHNIYTVATMATLTYDLNSNITHASRNKRSRTSSWHHSVQDGLPEWNKRVRTPLRTRNGPKVNGWTRKSFHMSSSSTGINIEIKLWKDMHEHMTSCIHSVFWGGISSPFLATISAKGVSNSIYVVGGPNWFQTLW